MLRGEANQHNDYVYGVHTTKGIIKGVPYPIRSIRDGQYKYIANLLPETKFQNIVTENDEAGYWGSWKRDAASNPKAAELIKRYQHRPAEEFYDITQDPFETKNLASDPQHRAKMDALKKQLQAWMKQQGDQGVATEMAAKKKRNTKQQKQNGAKKKKA